MSDGNAPDAARVTSGAQDGPADVDWTRIEASDEFRELTRRRHRFITAAAIVTFGAFAVYLALATFATGFMGTTVLGGVPIAWLTAMTQVFITWGVTWSYLRKADREFEPLERRAVERARARFTRAADAPAAAPAGRREPERSAR